MEAQKFFQICQEVKKEREKQDKQWGGASHDDRHSVNHWRDFIFYQYQKTSKSQQRSGFIKIAALAMAAVESMDRKAYPLSGYRDHGLYCYDCGREYGSPGFPDLIIPSHIWDQISPKSYGGGVLCPSCICGRLEVAGKTNVPAAFMSGPIRSVDPELMNALRGVENLREQLKSTRLLKDD